MKEKNARMTQASKDKELLIHTIQEFVANYPKEHDVETRWREPIIGIAKADDPRYKELKEIISPSHALPHDLVSGAKSVVVFFIPFEERVATSNIYRTADDEISSREWDYAYIETNDMLTALSEHLYYFIRSKGYDASNLPPTYNYDEEKLISDWSHRSSARIAGVGTFGINNMLITEAGSCGRLGSVITTWDLPADAPIKEEYCLYRANGTCGACLNSCPNDAFTLKEGRIHYDRYKCNAQIYDREIPVWPIGPGDTCGKCMCGMPCSTKNPTKHQGKSIV